METPLVWAEINLDAIAHNVRQLRKITSPDAQLMTVVKANAYGHGDVPVARTALVNGADALGVARIGEGIRLRNNGINVSILIFGYTPPHRAIDAIEYDLSQTVFSVDQAQLISNVGVKYGKKIRIHLKIDTGMGRLGLLHQSLDPISNSEQQDRTFHDILRILNLPGIRIEGIYTHFASSDSLDKTYALYQFELFRQLLDKLQRHGVSFPICHAANSGAIIDLPQTHLDLVRAGIATYGLKPSSEVDLSKIDLKPAMSLKSKIIQIKSVGKGFKVSYGSTYETKHATKIASVPIGYADGLNRLLSNCGAMLVHGQKTPIIGRVCMDLTMIDINDLDQVSVGDEVTVFGQQGEQKISVDDIADMLNTINYEVVCSVSPRVKRIYVKKPV